MVPSSCLNLAYKPIKILNVMYDFIKQHEREVGRKMPGVLVLCVTTVPVWQIWLHPITCGIELIRLLIWNRFITNAIRPFRLPAIIKWYRSLLKTPWSSQIVLALLAWFSDRIRLHFLIYGNGFILYHVLSPEIAAVITKSRMEHNLQHRYFLLSLHSIRM